MVPSTQTSQFTGQILQTASTTVTSQHRLVYGYSTYKTAVGIQPNTTPQSSRPPNTPPESTEIAQKDTSRRTPTSRTTPRYTPETIRTIRRCKNAKDHSSIDPRRSDQEMLPETQMDYETSKTRCYFRGTAVQTWYHRNVIRQSYSGTCHTGT